MTIVIFLECNKSLAQNFNISYLILEVMKGLPVFFFSSIPYISAFLFLQVQVADVDWIRITSGEEISIMVCLSRRFIFVLTWHFYVLL